MLDKSYIASSESLKINPPFFVDSGWLLVDCNDLKELVSRDPGICGLYDAQYTANFNGLVDPNLKLGVCHSLQFRALVCDYAHASSYFNWWSDRLLCWGQCQSLDPSGPRSMRVQCDSLQNSSIFHDPATATHEIPDSINRQILCDLLYEAQIW